jgi:nucleoside-diphosphate-sugar epimerase
MKPIRKILITGGAGFIGSSLAERLSEKAEYRITLVDNLLTGTLLHVPEGKHNNIQFIKCDVNSFKDISEVFYSTRFDWVFHYAAVVGVQRTLDNPVMVLDDLTGIANILNLSKNSGVERVFYSSSSEVYGEPVELPQNEDTTPLNSRLPYGIVKNVGEAFLKSYRKEFGLPFTIFRFFNTYGPKQSRDFVVSKFMSCALKNEPIIIYGDGSQSRTFCYVDDNVDACIRIAEDGMYIDDIVNIGSDREISILQLAQLVKSVCNSKSEIVHAPALPEGDMTRRKPDVSKMRQALQNEPISLEDGLKKILSDTSFIL